MSFSMERGGRRCVFVLVFMWAGRIGRGVGGRGNIEIPTLRFNAPVYLRGRNGWPHHVLARVGL